MKDMSKSTSGEIERYLAWQKKQYERYGRLTAEQLRSQLEACLDDELHAIMLEILSRRQSQ